ncbi:MAG: phosphoglycerate dehydrogenase [Myxococcota bacterium]
MTQERIVLLENIHPGAKANLEAAGYAVELLPKSLPEDELIATLDGAVAVGIRSKTQMTAKVLEASKGSLRAIGAFCIGTNQIDLEAAHGVGIPAFNAPFSNTRSVAELVMAEIVFLARRLGDRNTQMHQGTWKKSAAKAYEIRGKTMGIVGYGHIGRQVGVLGEAFGLKVLFHDVVDVLPMGNNQPAKSLDALLAASDFVTLHVPATPETKDMIGAGELAKMKRGSYLLNLSRGNVVELSALAEALRSGHLEGAALDVYPEEPRANDDVFETDLAALDNVILTPHIGGSTQEAQVNIGQEVSGKLIKYLGLGATLGAVNFPQADLPPRAGCVRVQHIHDNVAGVLGDVHRIVADKGGNILGQVLVTDPSVGYLLMDIEQSGAGAVVEQLERLETTRQARILSGA